MRYFAALAAVLAATGAFAQSGNPDISVIGDVRAFVQKQDGSTDPKDGEAQLDLDSVEFAFGGYLNPYARGDVFVAWSEDEGVSIEEAFVTILRGLPAGLQLKAGRYRVDFGKLNLSHPHVYSFLDTPIVHRLYLGEEGLMDVGVNLNASFPVGKAVVTPSFNVLKGDLAKTTLDTPDGEPAEEENPDLTTKLGTSQRLGVFVPTGDYAGFEIGLNALQGKLDDERIADGVVEAPRRKVSLVGADVKYRWAPDKYRSLTLQAEWIRSKRDVAGEDADHGGVEAPAEGVSPSAPRPLAPFDGTLRRVSASGFYAFADWRFRQRWNVGAIYDTAESPVTEGLEYDRVGVYGGFQLMEESTLLRLLLRRTDDNLAGSKPVREAVLQLVFALGPHKSHWF